MARGRMISNSLGSSRKFHALLGKAGKLGEFAQALFPLIVSQSDDFGRLEGDAFTVKHKVFPTSPRPESDFTKALTAMSQVGLIQLYEADGVAYLSINQFDDHQSGLHKRTKSKFPEPPGNSGNLPELPPEEKRTEGNGTEARGSEAPAPGGKSGRVLPVGLNEHPAVVMYWDRFHPERLPSIPVQEQMESKIGEDLMGWQEVLDFWDSNNYRPESIGKMLEKYEENKRGVGTANAKQTASGRNFETRLVSEALLAKR